MSAHFHHHMPKGIRLLLVASVTCCSGSSVVAQPVTATWNGTNANWTTPSRWSTNPYYPDNGNPPGITYNAVVNGPVSGRLTLNVPITIEGLTFANGVIDGSSDLTVNSNLVWRGAEFAGSGTIIVRRGSSSLTGGADFPAAMMLTGRTLSLQGASHSFRDVFGNVLLYLGGGGVLAVGPAATLDVSGQFLVINSGGGGTVSNAGTIIKHNSSITGVSSMTIPSGVVLNNSGLVDIQTGALTVTGTVTGSGRVNGPVTVGSGGVVAPGSSGPGTLVLSGPVTMGSGSNLRIELNGPTPGTGHDGIDLTGGGSIGLTGTSLSTLLGYAPSAADVLTIISGGPVSGTLAGLPYGTVFPVGSFAGGALRGDDHLHGKFGRSE